MKRQPDSRYQLPNLKLFDGNFVQKAVISVEQEFHEVTVIGEGRLSIPARVNAAAQLSLLVTEDDSGTTWTDLLARMAKQWSRRTSRYIGPAAQCPFCGAHWLPGTYLCPNCGGQTGWLARAIEWTGLRAQVTGMQYEVRYDSYASMEVSVRYSEVPRTWHDAMLGFFDDHPGDWLCSMCGCYVNGYVSKCPGCGGNVPRAEQLHDWVRECLYCGRQTQGGFACPACNQRLTRPRPTPRGVL